MAKPPIRIKRSAVSGAIPTTAQLALGELAINTADGKVFLKKDDGTESIVEIGAGGGSAGAYTAPLELALYEKSNSGSLDSFDGVETRFQLRDTSGSTVTISNALYVAVSVNGVVQKPNTGTPSSPFEGFYITNNATQGYDIVFDSAPSTGSDYFIVLAGTFTATGGTSGIKILDDISSQFNGTDTAFTLEYNSTTYTPDFPNAVVVSVGGVVQVPTDAYSISGSTITFTSAPPTGTSFYALSFEIGEAVDGLPLTGGTLTGDLTLNAQSDLRFADSDSSNWVAFQAPGTVASNVTWTLPDADASVAGYALVSDGAGNLSWSAAGGGATGGGSDKWAVEHDNTITTSYTITSGKNVISAGPISIQNGATVTIPTGSNWSVV